MIALAPPHKRELTNYESWLRKRNFSYHILRKGESVRNYKALILCGGPDIGKNTERDLIETHWFNEAYGKIPILGICRGMQLANIVLGGTIYEDLSEELVNHASDKNVSEETSNSNSRFHEVISMGGTKSFQVNSRHHQAINILGKGLSAKFWSKTDMIVESAVGDKSFFVQWHPEREEVYGEMAEKICTDWLRKQTL